MDTPRIYVACLAAYNCGYLHGAWISVEDSDDIRDDIQLMLDASPIKHAEEYAIHAYEGFGDKSLSDYEDIDSVVNLAEFIARYGELGGVLLGEYSVEEAETLLDDHYHGAYNSEVDFAKAIFDDCHSNAIPNNLIGYFDCDSFARDLFIGDYFSVEADGQTHVFSNY